MDGTQGSILPGGLIVEILKGVQDGDLRRLVVLAQMIGGVVVYRREADLDVLETFQDLYDGASLED